MFAVASTPATAGHQIRPASPATSGRLVDMARRSEPQTPHPFEVRCGRRKRGRIWRKAGNAGGGEKAAVESVALLLDPHSSKFRIIFLCRCDWIQRWDPLKATPGLNSCSPPISPSTSAPFVRSVCSSLGPVVGDALYNCAHDPPRPHTQYHWLAHTQVMIFSYGEATMRVAMFGGNGRYFVMTPPLDTLRGNGGFAAADDPLEETEVVVDVCIPFVYDVMSASTFTYLGVLDETGGGERGGVWVERGVMTCRANLVPRLLSRTKRLIPASLFPTTTTTTTTFFARCSLRVVADDCPPQRRACPRLAG